MEHTTSCSKRSIKYTRDKVLEDISAEREFQLSKWGTELELYHQFAAKRGYDNHKYIVAAEEFGEIARAILEKDHDNLYVEIIQTAAVLTAWAEMLTELRERTETMIAS